MARTVLRRIAAFDATLSTVISVEPGAMVQFCRILRRPAEKLAADVYFMEFECGGRTLRCPLVEFQARTEWSDAAGVEDDAGAGDGERLREAPPGGPRRQLSPG